MKKEKTVLKTRRVSHVKKNPVKEIRSLLTTLTPSMIHPEGLEDGMTTIAECLAGNCSHYASDVMIKKVKQKMQNEENRKNFWDKVILFGLIVSFFILLLQYV